MARRRRVPGGVKNGAATERRAGVGGAVAGQADWRNSVACSACLTDVAVRRAGRVPLEVNGVTLAEL